MSDGHGHDDHGDTAHAEQVYDSHAAHDAHDEHSTPDANDAHNSHSDHHREISHAINHHILKAEFIKDCYCGQHLHDWKSEFFMNFHYKTCVCHK